MALDRMISIREVKGKYQKNTVVDWQEYFEDIIGVTKPANASIENVVLHFNAKTGNYMETKPIHGSQKSTWISENILQVKLQVIINYELERLILSYADSVVVIRPKNIATEVNRRLISAVEHYQSIK